MNQPKEQRMIAQNQRDKDDDLSKLCERFYQSVCYQQMMRYEMLQCTSIQIIENEQIQKPKLDIQMEESMKQQQNQSQQKHSQDIQMSVQFQSMQPQIMIPNQSPNITNQITQQQQIITQIQKNKKKTANDKKRTQVLNQTCYVVSDVVQLNILQEIYNKLLSKDGIYNSNNKRSLHFIVITAFQIRKFIFQKGGCTYEIIQKETQKSYRKRINKLQETKYKHLMAQYLAGFLLIIQQPQFKDATDGILYIYSKRTSQKQQSIDNSQQGLKKMYEILESRKIINYNELKILRNKMLQWKVKF